MDDLISRQAVIDAIRASTSKYTGFMEMEIYTDDDAVEAINGVPSAQQWIPVSERLPKDSGNLLICRANGNVGEGCYHKMIGEWSQFRWATNGIKDVIAWMPLPEPYKEEQE